MLAINDKSCKHVSIFQFGILPIKIKTLQKMIPQKRVIKMMMKRRKRLMTKMMMMSYHTYLNHTVSM